MTEYARQAMLRRVETRLQQLDMAGDLLGMNPSPIVNNHVAASSVLQDNLLGQEDGFHQADRSQQSHHLPQTETSFDASAYDQEDVPGGAVSTEKVNTNKSRPRLTAQVSIDNFMKHREVLLRVRASLRKNTNALYVHQDWQASMYTNLVRQEVAERLDPMSVVEKAEREKRRQWGSPAELLTRDSAADDSADIRCEKPQLEELVDAEGSSSLNRSWCPGSIDDTLDGEETGSYSVSGLCRDTMVVDLEGAWENAAVDTESGWITIDDASMEGMWEPNGGDEVSGEGWTASDQVDLQAKKCNNGWRKKRRSYLNTVFTADDLPRERTVEEAN